MFSKRSKRVVKIVWTTLSILIAVSMIAAYIPASGIF
jgi:hypothetical protein